MFIDLGLDGENGKILEFGLRCKRQIAELYFNNPLLINNKPL
jgi:hypothetical protein